MHHPVFDLSNVPDATGRKKIYIDLWRAWYDQTDPLHNIRVHNSKAYYKSGATTKKYVRFQIRVYRTYFNKSWRFRDEAERVECIKLATAFRDSIPSEVFALAVRRKSLEVPFVEVIHGMHGDLYRAFSGTENYTSFSSAKYINPYDCIVKHIFDTLGVKYPASLFKLTVEAA